LFQTESVRLDGWLKRGAAFDSNAADSHPRPELFHLMANCCCGDERLFQPPGAAHPKTNPGRTEIMAKKAEKTMETLFHDGLKDIYYAEKKILRALPKMAKGANSEELRKAFETHRDETETQIERLEQVFEILGKRAQGKTCPAIDGIIEEGQEILEEYKGAPALDAGLVGAAQAVEHYEITRYGTLKRWAQVMGMDDAAKLLDQTLQEESKTDELLTKVADSVANEEALQAAE
jgi:ferritin-like metal-binding protein YciE